MMLFTINIPQKASEIIRQSDRLRRLATPNAAVKVRFMNSLRDFILTIEGFGFHIAALDKTELTTLVGQCDQIIKVFVRIDDELLAMGYFEDKDFEEMIKYSLKCLYRLKSTLHIAQTRDVPVTATPAELKTALSSMSGEAVFHRLTNRAF